MEVTLAQMLDARERRFMLQQQLLSTYKCTLICFTMNIAGPVKNGPLIKWGFDEGIRLIGLQLKANNIKELCLHTIDEVTGCEAFIAADAEALMVKRLTAAIEDDTPAGRLFDIDVLTPDGRKVDRAEVGRESRRCLLCDNPAVVCGSRRLHTVDELRQETARRLNAARNGAAARDIASLAVRSLMYEVLATPKPGLVDRAGSGSHTDMDIFTFAASAAALQGYFETCALTGMRTAGEAPEKTFDAIVLPGVTAEADMLKATRGVNTHKGAIYTLGIICAAAGRGFTAGDMSAGSVLSECGHMTSPSVKRFFGDRTAHTPVTAGEQAYAERHIKGIRGEAAEGFPSVRDTGLVALREALSKGYDINAAGVYTLLRLAAAVTDTNMIHRSSYETAERRRRELKDLLTGTRYPAFDDIELLGKQYEREHLSPGGCADLLSATWLVYLLETEV